MASEQERVVVTAFHLMRQARKKRRDVGADKVAASILIRYRARLLEERAHRDDYERGNDQQPYNGGLDVDRRI